MKRFFTLLLLLFVFSQNAKTQNKDFQIQRFELSIMPYSLIDYNPRLRLGLEYYSSDNLGFSMDFGIGAGNSVFNQVFEREKSEDYALFEFRAELKYFFALKESIAFYVGPEFFFITTDDVLESSWYRKSDYPQQSNLDRITNYERADFFRQKLGIHAKAGLKLIALKRIDFDFYAGIGIAFRTIEYSNILNPQDDEYHSWQDFWSERQANEGKSFLLNIALGTKIGFILWDK
jgi:hypothetical protein